MKHRDGSLKKDDTLQAIPLACADERAAVELIEAKVWGGDPRCPHCESRSVYQMTDRKTGERNSRWLWRCRECKRQFTVRINTIFQDSKIPMRFWVFAIWQMSAAKKGVSALQIRRQTGISYKSALFMLHRIRWAMNGTGGGLLGGPGRVIEADETYVGGKPRYPKTRENQRKTGRGTTKTPVFAVVERGGDVRMSVLKRVTGMDLGRAMLEQADLSSRLLTDEWPAYKHVGSYFDGGHYRVKHKAREYVRKGQRGIHSNTAESVFSLLKRGLMGTFHSVSTKHLHRYLAEFQFRWNTRVMGDGERFSRALASSMGKRLRYSTPGQ